MKTERKVENSTDVSNEDTSTMDEASEMIKTENLDTKSHVDETKTDDQWGNQWGAEEVQSDTNHMSSWDNSQQQENNDTTVESAWVDEEENNSNETERKGESSTTSNTAESEDKPKLDLTADEMTGNTKSGTFDTWSPPPSPVGKKGSFNTWTAPPTPSRRESVEKLFKINTPPMFSRKKTRKKNNDEMFV